MPEQLTEPDRVTVEEIRAVPVMSRVLVGLAVPTPTLFEE